MKLEKIRIVMIQFDLENLQLNQELENLQLNQELFFQDANFLPAALINNSGFFSISLT